MYYVSTLYYYTYIILFINNNIFILVKIIGNQYLLVRVILIKVLFVIKKCNHKI